MDGWTDGRKNGTGGRTGWTDVKTGRKGDWANGRKDARTNGRTDRRTDIWMDGRSDGMVDR